LWDKALVPAVLFTNEVGGRAGGINKNTNYNNALAFHTHGSMASPVLECGWYFFGMTGYLESQVILHFGHENDLL